MTKSPSGREPGALDRAIAQVEAALLICDEQGLFFAAIDLSAALDKLIALREERGSV